MDLSLILANIERLLAQKGITADKASKEAGTPDAIRNIKRKLKGEIKGRGVTVATLNAIAAVLGTDYAGLSTPREQIQVRPVAGLREEIVRKIDWLDREKARAIEELEALDVAERREKEDRAKRARR